MSSFFVCFAMIVLNECRIDPEGKNLVVEASVENLRWYKGIFIKAVVVDTDETFVDTGPSSNAIYKREFKSEYGDLETDTSDAPVEAHDDPRVLDVGALLGDGKSSYVIVDNCRDSEYIDIGNMGAGGGPSPVSVFIGKAPRRVRFKLSYKDLGLKDLNDNIFFVYIIAAGVPAAGTPCTMDKEYVMGAAFNLRPIYNAGMGFIKELRRRCDVPRGFIDFILRLKALEVALKTGNYTAAFDIWRRYFKDRTVVSSTDCGCE